MCAIKNHNVQTIWKFFLIVNKKNIFLPHHIFCITRSLYIYKKTTKQKKINTYKINMLMKKFKIYSKRIEYQNNNRFPLETQDIKGFNKERW